MRKCTRLAKVKHVRGPGNEAVNSVLSIVQEFQTLVEENDGLQRKMQVSAYFYADQCIHLKSLLQPLLLSLSIQ